MTLSSSIIWIADDIYNIVRKLGEYIKHDITAYDARVRDSQQYGAAIPNVDWYSRLENGGGSKEVWDRGLLYDVYKRGQQDGGNQHIRD